MAAVTALIERLQNLVAGSENFDSAIAQTSLSQSQLIEASQCVADELLALQAIYGEENVALLTVQRSQRGSIRLVITEDQNADEAVDTWNVAEPIRLALTITLDFLNDAYRVDAETADGDAEKTNCVRLSAILPAGYPMGASPPQLQLLSKYVGPHGVDHTLFARMVRVFMRSASQSANEHVSFEQGQVVLFDGIEKARELIELWYNEREKGRAQREEEAGYKRTLPDSHVDSDHSADTANHASLSDARMGVHTSSITPAVGAVKLITAPPITERKSTFVGHAAKINDPSDVEAILRNLTQDRRIARATHPAIYAWVCKTNDGVVHRNCDDDGEAAAGGRLAHLLDLLHLEQAIVIVTRWYGGTLLGPDRFKLINRAARDALESACLIEGPLNPLSRADGKSLGKNRK